MLDKTRLTPAPLRASSSFKPNQRFEVVVEERIMSDEEYMSDMDEYSDDDNVMMDEDDEGVSSVRIPFQRDLLNCMLAYRY